MSNLEITVTPALAKAELRRRARNSKLVAQGKPKVAAKGTEGAQAAMNLPGAKLRLIAGIKDQPKAAKKAAKQVVAESPAVPGTRRPHPMKGKSRLGLTPEQVKTRNELFTSTGGGAAYEAACTAAGIPTTKNGLVNA